MAEFWSNPKVKSEPKVNKPYRYTKKATPKKEHDYMGMIKSLPCACCGASPPSSAHHIREGQGTSQKAGNYLVVSLCDECHQGSAGIHGDRSLMRIQKLEELDLLNTTIGMIVEVLQKKTIG
jgi:hypothetical protein